METKKGTGTFRAHVKALSKITCSYYNTLKTLVLYGHSQPREFVVDPSRKIAYLVNSKVACSSIKACMYNVEIDDDRIHTIVGKSNSIRRNALPQTERDFFKFTFVRNPLPRLVSCYESKYHNDITQYEKKVLDFDHYLFGFIREDRGFEHFIRRIVKIPNCLMDKHFLIQYDWIHDRAGHQLVDYVGKLETLNEDFKEIQEKYNLKELPHFNRTSPKKNWMDFYTLETARLVHKKYRKDFEAFGYEDSYRKLIRYLKNKEKTGK